MSKPMISVILPVFNAELYLSEAIDSIIAQSFADFELIIINDGSTDASHDIILSYSDARIEYLANDCNMGLIFSLNKGLSHAKGKYIARMDSDDISLPDRFISQLKFMENNQDVVLCGSQIEYISNENIKKRRFYAPCSDEKIRNRLFVSSPIAHPTVFIRRSIICDNLLQYDDNYIHCEDYKLWVDISVYGKMANLDTVLLKYRLTNSQISQKYKSVMVSSAERIQKHYSTLLFGEKTLDFNTILSRVKQYPLYAIFLLKNENLSIFFRLSALLLCLLSSSRVEKLVAFKAFLRKA